MNRSLLCGLAVMVAILVGCQPDYHCYQIEVRPDGEAMQRKLTCWRLGGKNSDEIMPLAAGRLALIANLYPQRETSDDAKKHVFTGRFTGKIPDDVGGAGSYTHFVSSLGSTSAYVERFRGDDDLATQLAKRHESADKLADLLLGWMTAELGQDPKFPRLKEFIDKDVRRDLQNIAVYACIDQWTEDLQPVPYHAFFVRAGQYLCERGYLSPSEIPMLTRALSGYDPKPLLAHVQRYVARKLGVNDKKPVPESLAFLADPQRLKASLDKYIRSTEEFQKRSPLLKMPENGERGEEDSEEFEVPDAVAEFLGDVMGLGFTFECKMDSLDLALVCRERPYVTNGKWDEKVATVTWSKKATPKSTPPAVCFALWSTPDGGFQEAHFGKILLTDEQLAQYVIWYCSLKPEEAKEWDRLLDSLKPGSDLEAALKAFRFASDPQPKPDKPEEEVQSLADVPRSLILDHLQAKPASTESRE